MPISDLLSEIQTGVASPTASNFSATANNDFRRIVEKPKRQETPGSSRPSSDPRKDMKSLNGKKPVSTASSRPPAPVTASAPPKKGSFAEIMARGKAAQTSAPQIGKIQHKKIDKLPTRREREEAMAKKSKSIKEGLKPGGKFQKAGQPVTQEVKMGGSKLGKNGKGPAEPEKKVKKSAAATTGYTGTARPRPGGGLSSRSTPSSARDRYQSSKHASSRYTYASEEEEDDDDEMEEDDYESDGSSDMEAAAFELDEEEELASRIARQEDAEALREENRLKREKLERKRRMQALQKKAKSSKERY